MTFSKLGTDTETGQIVELSQASRRQGLYIIGANGTGTTGLIEHLILQDIDQGLGVGLLDPHGDLVNAILAKMTKREDDVILLDIQDEDHPFGLNVFECPNPQSNTAVQKIVDLVMHIFEKLYDVSRQTPRMAQFLRNCTHTLVANPGYTMADIPLLLQDGECRKKLVAQVTDPQVRLFWQTYNALKPSEQFDRAESTLNKMDELLQPLPRNIVGQGKTTVNIQQVMDERKILLVKLSAQLDQVTSLVGTLFIALFLNAAYSRANIPVNKRKQFNLYTDEFQRFATEDFATLLTEARKFEIATTIAHQARYQPGMTDGIRAVSLQAANHVVFRVTSPDADELAGGFGITPQAAWEEEIEKEWYERKEEDVLDGTKPIETPVKDVVGHLLTKGGHSNPVVNQFALTTLPRIQTYQKLIMKYNENILSVLNSLLYSAMTHTNPPRISSTQFLAELFYGLEQYGIAYCMEDHQEAREAFSLLLYENYTVYKRALTMVTSLLTKKIKDIELTRLGRLIHRQERDEFERFTKFIIDNIKTMTLNHLSIFPETALSPKERLLGGKNFRYYMDTLRRLPNSSNDWYDFDPTALEWEKVPDKTWLYLWKVKPGQNLSQFYNEADLDRVVDTQVQIELHAFEEFIRELKDVMQALANDPITVDSGLVQPNIRKHITYLTHPRKVIMHPQRTYQDVKNDVANQLSGFPNFTARVKLSEIVSHNPGKKCRHCGQQSKSGDKFCSKCGKELPNEYTFTTLKPLGGLGKAALQQRLTTIETNNRQKGYVQDRTKVEAEIIIRLTSCSSGSAPAQPQKQQQQAQQPTPQLARHARNVPVQGKCSKCGKTNPPGSQFCNQCGTKL